ncbi:MAG: tape measure protein, partial [Candidatus Paceibacterota bacterium]
DINQLTNRGIPIIKELAKQFGVTESEVKNLVESGDVGFEQLEQAFIDLTGEGSQFGGLMEEQAKTLPGLWSNFMDAVSQATVTVGEELIDAFNIKELLGDAGTAVGDFAKLLDEKG